MPLLYLKKEVRYEVVFLYAGKHQSFLQVDFNTWHQSFLQGDTIKLLVMIKYSQDTQSNKFAISLQYLKE